MTDSAIQIPEYVTVVEPASARPMRDLANLLAEMFIEDYGLPSPRNLTISETAQEISLQFGGGPDTFHTMARWAERFGGTLTGQRTTGHDGRPVVRCEVKFPFRGVPVEAYAYVRPGTPT